MYIDIIVLSHLAGRPSHGYELRKRVEENTAFVLHNNSLYPALRRFEEAGAVTKTAEPQQGRPPRHVYRITDVGLEQLHDMITELPAELAGDDNEFLTRLGLFDYLTPDERRAVLAARDTARHRQRAHLAGMASRSGHRPWGQAAVEELIRQIDADRAWLAELYAQADADPTPRPFDLADPNPELAP